MPLSGKAFIVIWHDIEAGFEREFDRWHTEEHMPERLGVPGFLRGRRYLNPEQVPQVCFTLYEIAHVEIFLSPSYLKRLNAPTPWSQQVQPQMRNFVRGVCEPVLSLGDGTAGAIATWRIVSSPGGAASAGSSRSLAMAAVQIAEAAGVTGVHLGRHQSALAQTPTAETALRPTEPEIPFEHVLMVEAIDLQTLVRETTHIDGLIADAGGRTAAPGCYRLAYQLLAPR